MLWLHALRERMLRQSGFECFCRNDFGTASQPPRHLSGRPRLVSWLKFQEALARRLQSVDNDLGDPSHQFITQVMIVFTSDEEARAIQEDRLGGFERPRLEVPDKGWE